MSERTASCLCGSVKTEIRGEPAMTNLCHCSSCQKFTGAVYGSMAAYKTEQLTFIEAEPSVLKTYDDTTPESGGTLKRSFCGKCGSPMRVISTRHLEFAVIPVGTIDGDKSAFKPQKEFFCKGRTSWVDAVEDSDKFEAMP
ncbi:Mss4-like protein [Astrocystis sublimbata]|nr:Mss4-like protein [Astrocystis sublimbata]